ncbi:unnamed protein product [Rotaria sp. Silwood1]|nr:unnamed protein product [Rotaria sp. Silwood1]CAF1646218.1 unnamed protein product [Rotaria sp. Silwood1]CAF3789849.1 unnamed protein product [Rotaria sp. Silwood1]CAF3846302.1 unnamed protein product [Rotaria sp. Silwood1]CAF3938283.1 unnamed protein product [Rotaria sp. Silwood1]
MSDKFVPYHLRDINNHPAHFDDNQKSNWICTAKKAKKNYQYQQQYPAFDIPTSFYEIIYIQTISQQLQFLVVLVELAHLPSHDTLIYVQIKQLFRLIFQSENQLYSWRPLREDIYPAVNNELFEWPIKSSILDIQLKLNEWYNWALSHCEVSSPSLLQQNFRHDDVNSNTNIKVLSKCTCHDTSLYCPGEKWGL